MPHPTYTAHCGNSANVERETDGIAAGIKVTAARVGEVITRRSSC